MSRIGKLPVHIVSGVALVQEGDILRVQGQKGSLSFALPKGVTVEVRDQQVLVSIVKHDKYTSALHGSVRAQIENMIVGVSKGWSKTLTLSGVGYRATVNGVDLVLTVGFSHPVVIKPTEGISFSVAEGKVVVTGIDKQRVGQVASDIRKVKPPEPYKGKGILYEGERVRKKAGKSAKGVGGAPGSTK